MKYIIKIWDNLISEPRIAFLDMKKSYIVELLIVTKPLNTNISRTKWEFRDSWIGESESQKEY